jgi:hypothetical protein
MLAAGMMALRAPNLLASYRRGCGQHMQKEKKHMGKDEFQGLGFKGLN